MGNNLAPNGLSRVQCPLLPVDVAEIVMHEAYDPDALVDLFDPNALTCQDVRQVDLLAVHADAAAGGDQQIAVVQGIV